MRISRQENGRAIVPVLITLAIAALAWSTAGRLWLRPTESARLISIEELPEAGDYCEREPASSPSTPPAAEDLLLLTGLQTPVYAQDTGGTVDVRRPPVRDILDTAPIYSSIGVDPQRTRPPPRSHFRRHQARHARFHSSHKAEQSPTQQSIFQAIAFRRRLER